MSTSNLILLFSSQFITRKSVIYFSFLYLINFLIFSKPGKIYLALKTTLGVFKSQGLNILYGLTLSPNNGIINA